MPKAEQSSLANVSSFINNSYTGKNHVKILLMQGNVITRNVHTRSQDLQYMSILVFFYQKQLSMIEALYWMIYASHYKLDVLLFITYDFDFLSDL